MKSSNLGSLAMRFWQIGLSEANGRWGGHQGERRVAFYTNTLIGGVLVAQGNLAEALKSFSAGLVIAERLAGSDTGNAD